MRRAALGLLAAMPILAIVTLARADGEGGDEWSRRMKQGQHDEQVQKNGGEEPETEAQAAERDRVHFAAYGGVGYGSINSKTGPDVSLAVGLRKRLSHVWTFQTRLGFDFMPVSLSEDCVYNYPGGEVCAPPSSPLVVAIGIDATFRVAFSAQSPIYFGFGPRVAHLTNDARSDQSSVQLAQALIEVGGVFGPDNRFDVGVRGTIGATIGASGSDHPTGGAVAVFGYSFY